MSELNAPVELVVEDRAHGWRVDHYLVRLFPNFSRAAFQEAIRQQKVLINGLPAKAARRLRVNDRLTVELPADPEPRVPAEDLPLDILYEDDHLVVINKAADMIVHPGRGRYHGTLAGALQFHFDRLSDVGGKLRPGIVHRLDRHTTGVLVVAKDNQVHQRLSRQFEQRTVEKEYRAIVHGSVERDRDVIETHLRVHPRRREIMQVCPPGGRARRAVTEYRVLERFDAFSLMQLLPQTGRTHQLRVHMQHLAHPIVGDTAYGGRCLQWAAPAGKSANEAPGERDADSPSDSQRRAPSNAAAAEAPSEVATGKSTAGEAAAGDLQRPDDSGNVLASRYLLHAYRLSFAHPASGERLEFIAPLPDDFAGVLRAIREGWDMV